MFFILGEYASSIPVVWICRYEDMLELNSVSIIIFIELSIMNGTL